MSNTHHIRIELEVKNIACYASILKALLEVKDVVSLSPVVAVKNCRTTWISKKKLAQLVLDGLV